MQSPYSCFRRKGSWMETPKQMSGMKHVSVLYNPPKSMGWYPVGIAERKITTSVIRYFIFWVIVKARGKIKIFGEG